MEEIYFSFEGLLSSLMRVDRDLVRQGCVGSGELAVVS